MHVREREIKDTVEDNEMGERESEIKDESKGEGTDGRGQALGQQKRNK